MTQIHLLRALRWIFSIINKFDGLWDFPKKRDMKIVDAKFRFFGSTKPQP